MSFEKCVAYKIPCNFSVSISMLGQVLSIAKLLYKCYLILSQQLNEHVYLGRKLTVISVGVEHILCDFVLILFHLCYHGKTLHPSILPQLLPVSTRSICNSSFVFLCLQWGYKVQYIERWLTVFSSKPRLGRAAVAIDVVRLGVGAASSSCSLSHFSAKEEKKNPGCT